MPEKPLSGPAGACRSEPPQGRAEAWTVKRLLAWTTQYFAAAGLDTPRLDAEVLLAHALGLDRLRLYLNYEAPVPEDVRGAFRALIQRRRECEPVAYLTGTREFFSLRFTVNPSVLIPRPETEHLVELALRYLRAWQNAPGRPRPRVLEIGTGCGNIAGALARHFPEARVVATDICRDALAVARENLGALTDASPRVSLVQGDLLAWLRQGHARFRLIVSNPPYVSSPAWESLPRDVRDHEPRTALFGGTQGTEIQERMLETAAPFLEPDGILLLEMGADQADVLRECAQAQGEYRSIRVFPDFAGRPRVLAAGRSDLPS